MVIRHFAALFAICGQLKIRVKFGQLFCEYCCSINSFMWTFIRRSLKCYAGCTFLPSAFGKSCPRWDWASATLYTLAKSSQFWRTTQSDSQARHETLWLVHHRPLKKRDLNEARHKRRGYTRGSKARRVFHLHFRFRPVSGFFSESVQPTLQYHVINTGNGIFVYDCYHYFNFCFCLHFTAISFTGHLNEYSQFACLQQLIRCFLFANVNESLYLKSSSDPPELIYIKRKISSLKISRSVTLRMRCAKLGAEFSTLHSIKIHVEIFGICINLRCEISECDRSNSVAHRQTHICPIFIIWGN